MNVEPIKELQYLTASQLKERGWTSALIRHFLGEPDLLKPNPVYKSQPPMRLYAISRVKEIEQREEWIQAKAKALQRSQTGKSIAVRKALELIEQAKVLPISVRRLSHDTVITRAIDSWNAWKAELYCERGHDYEPASKESDPEFLERITVNYIRHNLTEYDTHLEELIGRIGVSEAQQVIRQRVYDEIARVYPEYAEECKRQLIYRASIMQEAQEEGAAMLAHLSIRDYWTQTDR